MMNNDTGQWVQLHATISERMVSRYLDDNNQEDLLIDFGAYGLWVWKNNTLWEQLHSANPTLLGR
jgi:hypothetical protein